MKGAYRNSRVRIFRHPCASEKHARATGKFPRASISLPSRFRKKGKSMTTAKARIFRARWLALTAILLGSLEIIPVSHAQDKIELFGGYSFLRPPVQLEEFLPGACPPSCGPIFTNPRTNMNGWEFSGAYRLFPALSAVADFSGHYGSTTGNNVRVQTYLFGPQIALPARVSPFAHVLLGGAHESFSNQTCCFVGTNDSSFAMAVGAGIDAKIAPFLSWRILQGDYLVTKFHGGTQNQGRLSTGLVIRF